ncbi:MAG: aminoglycoside 6-adenylyltransferase [Chloroflexi bacterium]|nr:aminoglycoside 6-adenylyltransferase [Chloroflexota bacterium]
MRHFDVRREVKQRLLDSVKSDPRVVGCLDYGSTSEGRGDEWSDLDFCLFIRDDDLPAFEDNWKQWAAQFGDLLLAFISGVGHPWVVYDAEPMPLRVDFAFRPASTLSRILTWPNAPTSVEAMVLYDAADGAISERVAQIVGQSLAPADLAQAFEQVCGDFWYYLLRTHVKLLRGEYWAARHDFNFIVVGNLLALLRIEAGAVGRWRGSSAAVGIEKVLSEQRLAQLEQCIPGRGETAVPTALYHASILGRQVSAQIAQHNGWDWPHSLAEKVVKALK